MPCDGVMVESSFYVQLTFAIAENVLFVGHFLLWQILTTRKPTSTNAYLSERIHSQGRKTMSNLTLDVGLAAKLKVAFARNGWTEQLIDVACEGDKLGQFKQVLLGHASINIVEHVINCDDDPFIPDNYFVEEHQKGGSFRWDTSRVELYLADNQTNGHTLRGFDLRKEMAKKAPFNANVLDYLLSNPHLIPEEWKRRFVFFWGTVYRANNGYQYVRFLFWREDRWIWQMYRLDMDWTGLYPAAVRTS